MTASKKARAAGMAFLLLISLSYYLYIFSGQSENVSAISKSTVARAPEPPSALIGYTIIVVFFGIAFVRAVRVHLTSQRIAGQFASTGCKVSPQATQSSDLTPIKFTILVPARNERRVIENTMTRLAKLNYPRDFYDVVIIADAREDEPAKWTTADIATQHAHRLNDLANRKVFHVIEVPDSFDGNLRHQGMPSLRSTKGRALNYALRWLHDNEAIKRAEYIGVLDADGRLHPEALSNATRIWRDSNPDIIQGPVFQISNFFKADLVGIMAGIELSLHHISRMWLDLNSKKEFPRFLAGTNYFVKPELMLETGGWNSESLVEDAELGLHLYLKKKSRAFWLPAYEIEQTPPSWIVYLKQRERWALGHLQLLPIVSGSSLPNRIKLHVYFKILLHFIESPLDILLPIISCRLIKDIASYQSGQAAVSLMLGMTFVSLYTWGYLSRGLLLLNPFSTSPIPPRKLGMYSLLLILCMPGLAVLQLLPRVSALAKFLTNLGTSDWYKTERSKEPTDAIQINA